MTRTKTLTVTDMSCTGCEETVEDALRKIDGVRSVQADHEGDRVTVEADDDVAETELTNAISDAGYHPA
ncbi:heavy-metal-associated domain-containing protein [Halorientalis halophila]|uniref:heavy-metal-associated domain-containing protein n=1 Tax=Halorientalis halophila TaxID=3108499 RepID=UPI003008219F